MINEVNRASLFLLKLMRSRDRLSKEEATSLRDALVAVMVTRYHNHWFPLTPHRGSAYRCIRVNQNSDPVITAVGQITGLTGQKLRSWLPLEFTMWVDPNEVSYRIGENGSVMAVYVPDIEDMVDYIPDPIPDMDPSFLDKCKDQEAFLANITNRLQFCRFPFEDPSLESSVRLAQSSSA